MGLRRDRLADEIRDVVAGCFSGGQMRDPRLEFVTITAVKLSADLQVASIYYRRMNAEDHESTEEQIAPALDKAAGYFRTLLAKRLDVRRVPTLRFFYDKSVENGAKIEELLAGLR